MVHSETLRQYQEIDREYDLLPRDIADNSFIFSRNHYYNSVSREIKSMLRLKDPDKPKDEYLVVMYIDSYVDSNRKEQTREFIDGFYENIIATPKAYNMGQPSDYDIERRFNKYYIPFSVDAVKKAMNPILEIKSGDNTIRHKIPVINTHNIVYKIGTTTKKLGKPSGKTRYEVSQEEFLNGNFDQLWTREREAEINMSQIRSPIGKVDKFINVVPLDE